MNWEIVGLGIFLLVHAFILVTRETETKTGVNKSVETHINERESSKLRKPSWGIGLN